MIQNHRNSVYQPLLPVNSHSPLTLSDGRQELVNHLLSSALEDLATFIRQCPAHLQAGQNGNHITSFMQLDFETDDADMEGLEEVLLPSAPKAETLKLKKAHSRKSHKVRPPLHHRKTDPEYALDKLLDGDLVSVRISCRHFSFRVTMNNIFLLSAPQNSSNSFFNSYFTQSELLLENQPALRALLPSLSNRHSLKNRSSFMNMTFDDDEGEVDDDSLDDMLLQDDRRLSTALNVSLGLSRDSKMSGLVFHLEEAMKTSRRNSWINTVNSLDLVDDELEIEGDQQVSSGGIALVVLSMQQSTVQGSSARINYCSPQLKDNVKKLLSAWRHGNHGPIIHAHTADASRNDRFSSQASASGSKGVSYAMPMNGEATIQKRGSSAFWGTDLELILTQTGCHAGESMWFSEGGKGVEGWKQTESTVLHYLNRRCTSREMQRISQGNRKADFSVLSLFSII